MGWLNLFSLIVLSTLFQVHLIIIRRSHYLFSYKNGQLIYLLPLTYNKLSNKLFTKRFWGLKKKLNKLIELNKLDYVD